MASLHTVVKVKPVRGRNHSCGLPFKVGASMLIWPDISAVSSLVHKRVFSPIASSYQDAAYQDSSGH